LSVFKRRNLWLEWHLSLLLLQEQSFFLLFFVIVVLLSNDKSLLNLSCVSLVGLPLLVCQLRSLKGSLWFVLEIFTKILLLDSSHQMLLLFVFGEFILAIRVQVSVVFCNVLYFRWFVYEASVCLATELFNVDTQPLSLSINDILMMEVLDSSQKVFDVAQLYLSLAFDISSN
jgi:hypothetical protein